MTRKIKRRRMKMKMMMMKVRFLNTNVKLVILWIGSDRNPNIHLGL